MHYCNCSRRSIKNSHNNNILLLPSCASIITTSIIISYFIFGNGLRMRILVFSSFPDVPEQ
jgi:hypothetical protein